MKTDKTQLVLGAASLGAFGAFWRWHSPPKRKLTPSEIDHYMAIISKLPLPGDEIGRIVERLRPWAEADDGKATYMLNLIRYFPELHPFAGAPHFDGTPEQANAYYEKKCTPLWLRNASYPMVGGAAQGDNLIQVELEQNRWSTAQMVRYPSRRTFLKLLSHPSYAPLEPYKFMALEIDLVPVSGDKVIPDIRWIVGGGLFAAFLAVGWLRSASR